LVAVGDSPEASYIVLTCIVGLSDLGILLMIFVPKMLYRRQGLPEGVTVGESIFNKRRASSVRIDVIRQAAYNASRSMDLMMPSIVDEMSSSCPEETPIALRSEAKEDRTGSTTASSTSPPDEKAAEDSPEERTRRLLENEDEKATEE
jgi:hypothetical protein